MAAPTRLWMCVQSLQRNGQKLLNLKGSERSFQNILQRQTIRSYSNSSGQRQRINFGWSKKSAWKGSLFTLGSAAVGFEGWRVYAATKEKPEIKPSRKVHVAGDKSGLKLTLFQYQTCPFCCKVRAFLDFHGFSYDVVEVNSISRKQVKWSDYKKVPLLLLDGVGENGFLEMRDSCVIISLLQSYMEDPTKPLDQLLSFYPCIESKEGRKTVYDFPNKYFIMYGDNKIESTPQQRKDERKWRLWTDDTLVHMLSPNVYRSTSEALQAFRYFSEVGDWENNFSTVERLTIIYLGAAVMYVIGKLLKKKYKLKDDVRESLYDSCREWTRALKKKKFMGGDTPNLSDLAVYGVLSSIEGCSAFQDVLFNTDIGPWYQRTKSAIKAHGGSHIRDMKL